VFLRHLAVPGRYLTAVVLAGLLTVSSTGAAEGRDLGDIERELRGVREDRATVQERIDEATRAYEDTVQTIARLETEGEELEHEIAGLRAGLAELDEVMTERLRVVFKHGSAVDPLVVFLASDDPSAALQRAEAVQRAIAADQVQTEDLSARRERVDAAEVRLTEQRAELADVRAERERIAASLEADYAELQARVGELEDEHEAEEARIERERQRQLAEERRARQARQRAATSTGSSGTAAATSSGGMACPLDRPRSFIDSWGYARSGGRSHRGTDIMGPLGTPVRAITDGVWDIQRRGRSAGLWAILRGSNGHHYWYLHLNSHTVSDGARVRAGQQVGTNGSTGNASAGGEHIHFELHPGGGRAINPYPLLRSVCG